MAKIRYVKDNEWGTTFPNFRKNEFKCPKHCNGFPSEVAYSLLEVMQNLRNKYGSIHINSGVRCQKFNDELKASSKESDHRLGCACDWSFDSHIFSEAEKNEIMAYIRTLPNVKYTYTNQSNMYNGIHISVNPTYEDEPKVTQPVQQNKEVVQVYITYDNTMRCRTSPEIKDDNCIGFFKTGYYNVLEEKTTDYHWCKVAENNWVACLDGYSNYIPIEIKEETPQISTKGEDSTNTLPNNEITENGTKNEELGYKVNPLVEFIKLIIEFIRKIFMKGDK